MPSPWFVYILQCRDNSYYIGITTNIQKRVAKHRQGTGSKYVRSRLPAKPVYQKLYPTKSLASKREAELKKWSRKQKAKLIKAYSNSKK